MMMTNDNEFIDLSDMVISVNKVDGHWCVLWNGTVVRKFTCVDAEDRCRGYAMALLDQRTLRSY